jgi:hypothetical protein
MAKSNLGSIVPLQLCATPARVKNISMTAVKN